MKDDGARGSRWGLDLLTEGPRRLALPRTCKSRPQSAPPQDWRIHEPGSKLEATSLEMRGVAMAHGRAETWGVSERAVELHRSALVWDDHGGFGYTTALALEGLERWRASGIDYLSINAGYDVMPWTKTLEATSQYRHWIRTHPELFVQVEKVDDV